MAQVEGFQELIRKLEERRARLLSEAQSPGADQEASPSFIVSYSTAYAVHVHERLDLKHAPGKQAKFLEEPARTLKPEFGRIVREAIAAGASLAKAILMVALRLQRESMKIVPVDKGILRASCAVEKEK